MKTGSLFQLRTAPTEGIIELLCETTLGTNGAMYRHLDTRKRIHQADNPLFLSIERNNKVVGNITFCRRGRNWYIRYFAFRSYAQGGTGKKKQERGDSLLKRELRHFFDQAFQGVGLDEPVQAMYAYIDPANDRSMWMSENFGFHTVARLATQSYSRVWPRHSNRLVELTDWSELREEVRAHFQDYDYYVEDHCRQPPFYALKDSDGQFLAFARVSEVHWEMVRLPGKMGGILTKLIPWIPLLRRIIKPKNHRFLVPEMVWCRDQRKELLTELYSALLARYECNLLLWWTDQREPLYKAVKDKMRWGLLHQLVGVNPVDVVERSAPDVPRERTGPVFVTAFDMI